MYLVYIILASAKNVTAIIRFLRLFHNYVIYHNLRWTFVHLIGDFELAEFEGLCEDCEDCAACVR